MESTLPNLTCAPCRGDYRFSDTKVRIINDITKHYFNIFISMKEETPKDITPIKRKGIDLTVKGLRRPFPFIIGYKDDESIDKYESAHYIDLLIDLNKLSEYMGVPVNPYWKKIVEETPSREMIYAIWSYLKFPYEVSETNIREHPGFILGEEIMSSLETLYEYLPEEYKLYYTSNTSYISPPPEYPVRLKINGYIMT